MKIKALKLGLALFLAGLLGQSAFAKQIKPPSGFEGKVFRNTLALYIDQGRGPEFSCTVAPYEKVKGGYHLISAGHCVQLSPTYAKFFVADKIGGPLTPLTLVKARLDSEIDFSEFYVATKKTYSVVKFGNEYESKIGDETVNANFTGGVGEQLARGVIASGILSNCGEFCDGGILVQMFAGPGSSGSIVYSKKSHKAIGIIVSQFGPSIAMEIEPISKFQKFLNEPGQDKRIEDDSDY